MTKVLPFQERSRRLPDNVVTLKPFEFRSADWESAYHVQMLKSQSEQLERHRKEVFEKGESGVWHLPPHFVLRGGLASTIRGIYQFRENEVRMREVYYLAGLVDCMINRVSPILRTARIDELYRKVTTLKQLLNVNWYGSIDHVLLPLDTLYFNDVVYRETIARAGSMKALFHSIREGTDEMFDILSLEYCFYTPSRGR
ncbi:MAG: hypothetical protein JXL84_04890 [Deltaproteobacteria bacterium]|nr:hypothetical protein [Deltaproteobacteria bacterium]